MLKLFPEGNDVMVKVHPGKVIGILLGSGNAGANFFSVSRNWKTVHFVLGYNR